MPNFSYLAKNWDMYTYPWRPNKVFLEEIDKYILSDNLNILILGATKEFRDYYKNSHKITVCDLSSDMINANDVGNKEEIIITQNWLELDDTKYDIILGDLIFFLLKEDEKKSLLEKIKNKLSKNGKFIFRTAFKKQPKADTLFLQNIKKINSDILKFNYITFELVIGYGFNGKTICDFLEKNKIDFNEFNTKYLKFTPYNTSKINVDNKSNFNILLSSLNIINFSSQNFVFLEECIYVTSLKND